MPTRIVDEDEEEEESNHDFEDAERIEPFTETNLYLMLDGDAYEVVIKDEGSMDPAEFISDGKDGDEAHPDEGVFENKTKQKWLSDGDLKEDVYDKPQSPENGKKSREESCKFSGSDDSDLMDDASV